MGGVRRGNSRGKGEGVGVKTMKVNYNEIKAGDRVTVLVANGCGRNGVEWKERTGRAVFRSEYGWALNMGGAHGTPGVANGENFVRATRR